MKMPIAWHENNLTNLCKTLAQMRQRINAIEADWTRANDQAKKLEDQLAIAKQRGMDGFDADRLGVKRN